jgi:ActR/RegA family two-component response regulator
MRVLTVLSDRQLASRLQGVFSRRSTEVNRVPSGAGALILTGNLSYNLIVVELPLSDLAVEDFLGSIRTLDSTSTNSPVLILADEEDAAAINAAVTDELVKALPKEVDDADLHAAISGLLGVAYRHSLRVMVQIEVGLENGISTRLYQAENISETGVLVRGGRHIPVGTPVRFEFSLPSENDPIAGIGLVVRHTGPGEEALGIALQFAELAEDNIQRLRRFTSHHDSQMALATGQESQKPDAQPTVDSGAAAG